MNGFLQLLRVLGVNAVPAWGIFEHGWGTGTALVLYWCENVLTAILVGLRIAIHRRLTRKAGYWGGPKGGGFTSSFLLIMFVFSAAHGVFLAFVLALVPPFQRAGTDFDQVRAALLPLSGFLLLGFFGDLVGIRERPFAWIRRLRDHTLQRMVVIHLTIIFGMLAAALLHGPSGLLGVFVVLKLLLDLYNWLPQRSPERPPGWLARIFDRLRSPDQPTFSEFWTKERRQEKEGAEAEERVLTAAEVAQLEAGRNSPGAATSGENPSRKKKRSDNPSGRTS
ncbi:MAG: DUF6498-containing protein [Acidobacteriota bacterium]|nr:DUF6498-containing protein [Acidobacteriota bacterium]